LASPPSAELTPQNKMANEARILVASGGFHATVTGLGQSIQSATQNNPDHSLSGTLDTKVENFTPIAHYFAKHMASLKSAQELAPGLNAHLAKDHQLFVTQTMAVWQETFSALQRLLNQRLTVFQTWMNFALGLSAFTTLAAIGLAMTVMRRLLLRLDDRIIYLAHHDAMTKVKNRVAFTEEMTRVLENADRTGEKTALHLIDLDRFKTINDSMGHPAGDAILTTLAQRLVANSRANDIVGRLGGDEFVVLQRNISEANDATLFVNRVLSAMREPVPHDGQYIRASISVGTALAPLHAVKPNDLIAYADMALYGAKAEGRDRGLVFTRELNADVKRRQMIESEITKAVNEQLFSLHFQPQFDASGTVLRGFEALLRLRTTAGENIPPNIFVPIAEQMGLIGEISTWVINHACKVATNWPKEICLAVNLSPIQFTTGGVCQGIAQALKASGLEPGRLQVEITEGILMDDTQMVLDELVAIRALGVSIAMDDFGTGYSSLAYLWRFPFDKIKIDRSFMQALDKDPGGAENILRTIIMLGHSLAMQVTVEGVETTAQADLVKQMKCDEIQGFIYGRPLPEQDLAAVILNAFRKANPGVDAPAIVRDEAVA
jgi:diguanylate cyclase (GGDEF)-like protein